MPGTVTVVSAGVQTTVQDLPGRSGLWGVGVPPSGAWDDLSFALANLAVGNPPGAAGLEAVVTGPALRFSRRTLVCITGAARSSSVDGQQVRPGVVVSVPAGTVLDVGPCGPPGLRASVAMAGGIAVPQVLGSRATFLLGGFGGLDGRALVADDELRLGSTENLADPLDVDGVLPAIGSAWRLRVVPGPHGAPEHLTPPGVDALFETTWTVDHRADRTGVRLVGGTPDWARDDGGEAGLHPSNIHDSAYPVGAIMLSGDTPVIVGPDGPSLGGFVVPCVIVRADRWKLAQLRPGDAVQLWPVTADEADRVNADQSALLTSPRTHRQRRPTKAAPTHRPEPLLAVPARGHAPAITVRRAGDHHLLVEAGAPVLDLTVRLWIHLLAKALRDKDIAGIQEMVEGVRSLLVAVDETLLPLVVLAAELERLAAEVPDPEQVVLDVRDVTLPIAFDHPDVHEAMARYARSVRPDAPWCPDNVEFIRRINALDARVDVFDVVQSATYLVLGLGDVYLGAPVAVPLDPRHRLVTTKYDPARTWTPQNAVGIGGVYLCVYGMEGPGGYQLVGRTVPVWRRLAGSTDEPWLLRHFDRLRFRPVSAEELAESRAQISSGRADLDARPSRFSLAEVSALEAAHAEEIATFRARRQRAFADERARWGRR